MEGSIYSLRILMNNLGLEGKAMLTKSEGMYGLKAPACGVMVQQNREKDELSGGMREKRGVGAAEDGNSELRDNDTRQISHRTSPHPQTPFLVHTYTLENMMENETPFVSRFFVSLSLLSTCVFG